MPALTEIDLVEKLAQLVKDDSNPDGRIGGAAVMQELMMTENGEPN